MKRRERIWLALSIGFLWISILLHFADAPMLATVIVAGLFGLSISMFANIFQSDE